jgi:hypothetical protein
MAVEDKYRKIKDGIKHTLFLWVTITICLGVVLLGAILFFNGVKKPELIPGIYLWMLASIPVIVVIAAFMERVLDYIDRVIN